VVDGYGFHEGYFHHQKVIKEGKMPSRLSETGRHVFLQGLGRSLWFVHGADVLEISQTIAGFHPEFRGDAWSGAGLACAYAGGVSPMEIKELRWCAGSHAASVAQGAAFAVKARQVAGNPARHTEIACEILCGMSTQRAAGLCDETLAQISNTDPSPYQRWRELLRNSFASSFNLRGNPLEFASPLAAQKHT
jgi:enediyne biosynthesis protein E3